MDRRTPSPERRLLFDTLCDYVEQIRSEGMEGLPLGTTSPARIAQTREPAHPETRETAAIDAPASDRIVPKTQIETEQMFSRYPGLEKTTTLEELREFIGDCERCKLCKSRTQVVFGVGNSKAELMFVGEGPGAEEDARGEPFVGRAGQLLTDIIERGMGMKRSDVYIANVVKCRPPGNRNPEPDEVAACEPFLARQVELVKPRAIVALGTFAAQALLRVKTPISKLRGIWHEVGGVRTMPTFHPAYLLRNPGDKRLVWLDIQEVMKELGRPVSRRGKP
jgi:DNA polymerase